MEKEKIQNSARKLNSQIKKLEKEVRDKTFGYIMTALGFVVALAWNDAIKTLIQNIFPLNKDGLWAKFIYAILLTVIIVIATIYLTKPVEKKI